jgi:hypothetical protein
VKAIPSSEGGIGSWGSRIVRGNWPPGEDDSLSEGSIFRYKAHQKRIFFPTNDYCTVTTTEQEKFQYKVGGIFYFADVSLI